MTGNKYEKYYHKVKTNQENFELILDELQNTQDFDTQLKLAVFALDYATYNNTGYFVSSKLEQFFVNLANSIDINNYDIKFKENSFLHVLTTGYKTGGHTRVVERWIENAPNSQSHSVVIINPNKDSLKQLEQAVENKSGQYIYFDNKLSIQKKALKLRELGLHYQYIILHTHMEDATAVVAFGTEKFTRPVIFYNHGSHMFWIGKSIADLVLDLKSNDEITTVKRNIKNNFVLGVPSKEIQFNEHDKFELRRKLNLPVDKKIIVSSGSEYKFTCICDDDFSEIFKEIIDDNTYCYIIGLPAKKWENLYKKSNKHIIPLDSIDFNKGYIDYLAAADLYLDSYPLCGITSAIDAISAGTPSLSLKSLYSPADYLTTTSAYCLTKEEFINKAKRILSDKSYAKENLKELQTSLKTHQNKEVWNKKVEQILNIQKHSVKDLSNDVDNKEICDLALFTNLIRNKDFLEKEVKKFTLQDIKDKIKMQLVRTKGIPFLFQVLTYKNVLNQKQKTIKLLGITVLKYSK